MIRHLYDRFEVRGKAFRAPVKRNVDQPSRKRSDIHRIHFGHAEKSRGIHLESVRHRITPLVFH
jgi:hypothetical protein